MLRYPLDNGSSEVGSSIPIDLNGMNNVPHADMNGPLELHIDLWFTFLKESLVDGKHIVEVLGVLNQLFIELGHLRIDVGRLIGGQAGVGGDGEETKLCQYRRKSWLSFIR